jgi:hypothetical protein
MQNVFIKPAPMTDPVTKVPIARVVPDPQQGGRPLAATGEWKPLNSYWAARLRDDDVVEINPPLEPAPAPVQPKPDPKPSKSAAKAEATR